MRTCTSWNASRVATTTHFSTSALLRITTAWTQPRTAAFNMARIDGQMYEYAYHEANRGMTGLLAGARVQEAEAAKTGTR